MEVLSIETPVHGRVLIERREPRHVLVGFHGYGETAELHMSELRRLPGSEAWTLVAIQALHPFYIQKTGAVVASWMTSVDRDVAIHDNIEYVRRALSTVKDAHRIVFAGFSQGAAMAYRAAAFTSLSPAALIILGGDVPPDVVTERPALPPVLVARGSRDEWYSAAKFEKDMAFLRTTTNVTTCVFEGGHEWSDEFRSAAGKFLLSFRA